MKRNSSDSGSKEKKSHSKLWAFLRYFLLILILGIVALLIWWFFSTRETETYEAPLTPVQVEKPSLETIKESLTLSGYVEAEAMIPVVPFVSGNITEYYAHPGDEVKKDDVLAVIDSEPYRLQREAAEAQAKVYESTYQRVKNLYDNKAATAQQLDEVQAQLDAANAQLELVDIQIGYATVKSPIDGTVLMAPQAVGDVASTQNPIAVVADISKLIIKLNVPEKYFSEVNDNKENLKIEIIRPESNVSSMAISEGEVLSVSPYVDPTTKTFQLEAKLKTNIEEFRPGMYVKATITFNEEEVYALPLSVRKLDNSVYYVDYDSENDVYTAEHLMVEDTLEDQNYFEIGEEWKDTSFITRGQNSVLSGQRVEVVEGF